MSDTKTAFNNEMGNYQSTVKIIPVLLLLFSEIHFAPRILNQTAPHDPVMFTPFCLTTIQIFIQISVTMKLMVWKAKLIITQYLESTWAFHNKQVTQQIFTAKLSRKPCNVFFFIDNWKYYKNSAHRIHVKG